MRLLYNLLIQIATFFIRVIALFNTKLDLFVSGRKNVFDVLKNNISDKDSVIWIHAASLGEFEQGRPLIEEIKKKYIHHKIVLTFFSPSGYEIRKDYELADVVCYLPMDTILNAKKFIKQLNPKIAVFIKYEFWPNYLTELKANNIPTFLVSGIFNKDQVFFKPQGFWIKKKLETITHFFVQDQNSSELLKTIGFTNVSVAGDTRFDRVQKLLESNTALSFVDKFKNDKYLLVAGSTWEEDEVNLVSYINIAHDKERFIIAPHNIDKQGIERLKNSISKKVILYSEMLEKNMADYEVLIVDTIGILSKIYAYADVAYIGGGYTKSGVHNTLEAATYGLPIVIGPNFKKFKEVKDLVKIKGIVSVDNKNDLQTLLNTFFKDNKLREQKAEITKNYVSQNLGATQKIMTALLKYLK